MRICNADTVLFVHGQTYISQRYHSHGVRTCLLRFSFGTFSQSVCQKSQNEKLASLFAVALAMIAGRAVNAVAGAALLAVNNAPFFPSLVTKFLGNFTSTWAGIVLQLVLVPSLVFALQKSGVLARYLPPQEKSADISQSESEGQNGFPDATHQQNTDG